MDQLQEPVTGQGPLSSGLSFLNWPRIREQEIVPGMVVVFGVPSDFTGATMGPRLAPRAIREQSVRLGHRYREPGPGGVINMLTGEAVRLRQDIAVGDLGDCDVYWPRLEPSIAAIEQRAWAIASRGGIPVMLGGDHYVSYPCLAGYHDARRERGDVNIGYIQIDAHMDFEDNTVHGPHWHACNGRLAADLEGIAPRNMVWLGLNDLCFPNEWAFLKTTQATGMTIDDVRTAGIDNAVATALEAAGDGCQSIYLTVCIDAVDHAHAPGTGFFNFGGLTATEFLQAMRLLGRSPKIGGIDFVEVAPPLDRGDVTSYLAARALIEFLAPRILETSGA